MGELASRGGLALGPVDSGLVLLLTQKGTLTTWELAMLTKEFKQ